MPKRHGNRLRVLLLVVFLLGLLWLIACGGGSTSTPEVNTPPAPPPVKLVLSDTLNENGTITVTVDAEDVTQLYQMSCRLSYDPEVVEPLDIRRGELIDDRAIFFTSDVPKTYVPVAFTYNPGETIPLTAGTLVEYTFTVLDSTRDAAFSFNETPEFLIVGDSTGKIIDYVLTDNTVGVTK